MSRKSWLLAALAVAEEQWVTPVQLQKALFLLGKKRPSEVGTDFYVFAPYHYGPFCLDIYNDINDMIKIGLVETQRAVRGNWKEYRATAEGRKEAATIRAALPAEAVSYLARLISWAASLSFSDLVRKIYAAFPEYRENSIFFG